MSMGKEALRDLVIDAINRWRDRLRLPSWPVYVMSAAHETLGGNVAMIEVRDPDCECLLTYADSLPPELVDHVIGHEMAHWLLHALAVYAATFMTKTERRHYERLADEAVEAIALAIVQPDRSKPFGEKLNAGRAV